MGRRRGGVIGQGTVLMGSVIHRVRGCGVLELPGVSRGQGTCRGQRPVLASWSGTSAVCKRIPEGSLRQAIAVDGFIVVSG